jgi:hypothetical protein
MEEDVFVVIFAVLWDFLAARVLVPGLAAAVNFLVGAI